MEHSASLTLFTLGFWCTCVCMWPWTDEVIGLCEEPSRVCLSVSGCVCISPTSPSLRCGCDAFALFLLFVSSGLSASLLCHWLQSFCLSASLCLSRRCTLTGYFQKTRKEKTTSRCNWGGEDTQRGKKTHWQWFREQKLDQQSDSVRKVREEEAVHACAEQRTAGLFRSLWSKGSQPQRKTGGEKISQGEGGVGEGEGERSPRGFKKKGEIEAGTASSQGTAAKGLQQHHCGGGSNRVEE